jgi:hypothetical protein
MRHQIGPCERGFSHIVSRTTDQEDVRGSNLDVIVRLYRQRNLGKAVIELRSFAAMTFEDAVQHAGLAERFSPKKELWVRCDHQRRIPRLALDAVRRRLIAARIRKVGSFHELFSIVDSALGGIPSIGELVVYDTALRIGANLGFEPDRVYLHRGTRRGARPLGLNWRAEWLLPADLPKEFRSLPAWQVEDILCIFKDWFTGRGGRIATCGFAA